MALARGFFLSDKQESPLQHEQIPINLAIYRETENLENVQVEWWFRDGEYCFHVNEVIDEPC